MSYRARTEALASLGAPIGCRPIQGAYAYAHTGAGKPQIVRKTRADHGIPPNRHRPLTAGR